MPNGSMNRRILLDFDGTLVDSRRRQYELFIELARGAGPSFDEYWRCKRAGLSQGELLRRFTGLSGAQAAQFKADWMQAIEDPARLEADEVLPGVHEFLARVAREHQLFLVTGRQHFDRLVAQMKALNLHEHFTGVLNTEQKMSKVALVRSRCACAATDLFIGDMGEDILAGRELGVYTVGVLSGASGPELLASYQPDLIVASVAGFEPRIAGGR
jgi:phosphoglycolate phosphatase